MIVEEEKLERSIGKAIFINESADISLVFFAIEKKMFELSYDFRSSKMSRFEFSAGNRCTAKLNRKSDIE